MHDRALRASALGRPWRMGWGGKLEGGSGWGTHVHPWLIHVNVWQKSLQYCKAISLQLNKLISKKKGFLWQYSKPLVSNRECSLIHPQVKVKILEGWPPEWTELNSTKLIHCKDWSSSLGLKSLSMYFSIFPEKWY